MDLDDFEEEATPLRVPFGVGRELNLTYRPNAGRLRDALQTDPTPEQVVGMIVRIVATWDLVRSGAPVPITPDALMDMPVTLLAKVQEAVMADIQGPPTNGSSSNAT